MKRIVELAAMLAVFAMVICGCVKQGNVPQVPTFLEAQKCEGTVNISVCPETKVTSLTNGNDGYTATCIENTPLSSYSLMMVGYHGINGVQKGMVQLVNLGDRTAVKSELDVNDARVNAVAYCKLGGRHYAVIGVDRPKAGSEGVLCGVILVEIVNGKFEVTENTIKPYKVSGISLNSITWPENSQVLFTAAGGNDALVNMGDEGLAGFTKFGLFEDEGEAKLTLLAEQASTNFRGYCINWDNTNDKGLLTYSYRKVDGNDLVWMIGAVNRVDRKELKNLDGVFLEGNCVETEVYRESNTTVNKGKFSVTSTYQQNRNWIIACTGNGGIKIYHHNKTVDNDNFEGTDGHHTLDLKVSIDKFAVNATVYSKYIYTASGQSCYKYEMLFNNTMLSDVSPVGRIRNQDWPSVNYVRMQKAGMIYIAAGEAGVERYSWNSPEFVPANE